MILATGAAVSASVKQLIVRTRFLYNLIGLDEAPSALRTSLGGIASGIWGIDDDDQPHDLGIASAFLIDKATTDLLHYGKRLFASGAVSDRLLKAINAKGHGITLIARDFTKLFVSPEVYAEYCRAGNTLQVLQRSRLIAITLNPTSPQGFLLDSKSTCQALAEALQTPVYDVMQI